MLGQLLSTEKLTFVAKNRYNVLGWLPTNLNWYRVLSFSEWAFLKIYSNIRDELKISLRNSTKNILPRNR